MKVVKNKKFVSEMSNKRRSKEEQREQRRNTRMGAVIAIVAIIGAVSMIALELTVDAVNIWPKSGVFYWYKIILFALVLAISVVMIIDIAIYVVHDLNRHNVLNINYKKYDKKSDISYATLMKEFKLCMIVLSVAVFILLPLNVMYGAESERWNTLFAMIVLLIMIGSYVYYWIHSNNIRNINVKEIIDDVSFRMLKLLACVFCCYLVCVNIVLGNEAVVEVNYHKNGSVEICNKSSENYQGLDIEIVNCTDGIVVFQDSISIEEILLAWEDKFVSNQMGEGIDVNSEIITWKYLFDLNKGFEENERYYVSITIYQEEKSVLLKNTFYIDCGEYIYTSESMKKEY